MKYLILPSVLSVATMAANAALIVHDPFATGTTPASGEYTAASALDGQSPTISGMTGTWHNASNVDSVAAGLDYSDTNYLAESGGSANVGSETDNNGRQGRLLSTPYTDASVGTVYLSFLMQTGTDNVDSYRAFELQNGGFVDGTHRKFQIGFQNGDFASGGTNYGVRLFNDNTNFRSALGVNDTNVNLFVAKFVFSDVYDGDSVTIWHNPDLTSGDDPTGGVSFDTFNMAFDRVTFAKYGDSNGVSWDEFRLGDTFADVTGATSAPGASFFITDILHDTVNDTFTVSWTATEGESYGLFHDRDLRGFVDDIDDGILADPDSVDPLIDFEDGILTYGPFDNPTPGATELFFRAELVGIAE